MAGDKYSEGDVKSALSDVFKAETRRAILDDGHRPDGRAADQIRDEFADATWQAFWMTGVEGRPAKDVANMLSMNVSNVYVCKSRVIARLRERIEQIEGE